MKTNGSAYSIERNRNGFGSVKASTKQQPLQGRPEGNKKAGGRGRAFLFCCGAVVALRGFIPPLPASRQGPWGWGWGWLPLRLRDAKSYAYAITHASLLWAWATTFLATAPPPCPRYPSCPSRFPFITTVIHPSAPTNFIYTLMITRISYR